MPRKKKEGTMTEKTLETKLVENLVELQKIHTNLLEKFDKLSGKIASLLNLFEMTAKTFADNPANQITQKDKEFLEKIDKLLEQNKTIAKGLLLMEEKIRSKPQAQPAQVQMPPQMQYSPMQTAPFQGQLQEEAPAEEFQPSIANFPAQGKPLPKF